MTWGSKGTSEQTSPREPKRFEKLQTHCPNCPEAVRASVHDLLEQLEGVGAKTWNERESTLRWFLASGAHEAMRRHGWLFEAWEGGGVMCERIENLPATPKQIFLQHYEFTGDHADYVSTVEVRGHWLAEHCSVLVKDRGDGAAALMELGGTRGRVKGVGSVIRGIRPAVPMTVEEIAAVFDAEVLS